MFGKYFKHVLVLTLLAGTAYSLPQVREGMVGAFSFSGVEQALVINYAGAEVSTVPAPICPAGYDCSLDTYNANCPDGYKCAATAVKTVTMNTVASIIAQDYYFGGMYSGAYPGYAGYKNPLAGDTFGCPANYKKAAILGTSNIDNSLYICIGSSNTVTKVAEFGGMYSPSSQGYSGYKNVLASNTFDCPSGYTKQLALQQSGIDNSLYYCYSKVSPPVANFGGAYGSYFNGSITTKYINQVSGSASCLSNYKSSTVFGLTNVDYPITYCYSPIISTSTPPIATTTPPIATSTPPVATSTPPIATSTPPIATSTPKCTSTSPEASIYVIMGQSNAIGLGKISQASTSLSVFQNANWPFSIWLETDQTTWKNGSDLSKYQYFGPDLMIAQKLVLNGEKDFYIFKYAVGGTSMMDWLAGNSLYSKSVVAINKAKTLICNGGKKPVVKAIFWMQGEGDSVNAQLAINYGQNLQTIINSSRKDFGTSTTPFIIGLINNSNVAWTYANVVRNWEKSVANPKNRIVWTETNDLSVYSPPCTIYSSECNAHYDTKGQINLGQRFYDKYFELKSN